MCSVAGDGIRDPKAWILTVLRRGPIWGQESNEGGTGMIDYTKLLIALPLFVLYLLYFVYRSYKEDERNGRI